MYKSDVKIFELIELLKALGLIKFDYEFCESIDIQKQNLTPIKKGLAHFTARHIQNICEVYKVNANFIFGLEENPFRPNKNKSFNQNSTLIKKQISLIKTN
jgi:hypothetical protein